MYYVVLFFVVMMITKLCCHCEHILNRTYARVVRNSKKTHYVNVIDNRKDNKKKKEVLEMVGNQLKILLFQIANLWRIWGGSVEDLRRICGRSEEDLWNIWGGSVEDLDLRRIYGRSEEDLWKIWGGSVEDLKSICEISKKCFVIITGVRPEDEWASASKSRFRYSCY